MSEYTALVQDAQEAAAKIKSALDSADNIDGAHHKQWIIDQMVRALTGCPIEQREGWDHHGNVYTYSTRGESSDYQLWIATYKDGEDGPETYAWDTGIAP